MKNIRNFFVVIILLITSFSTISAQNKSGVSIHLGGALPLGQFTQTPAYIVPCALGDKSSAIFGASFGLRYNYAFIGTHIEDSGFGIFLSADAMWNYVNKDVRDKYDSYKCTKPMYINVPIIIGGTWMSDFQYSPVNVWGEVGIGCDLFLKTKEGWNNALVSYKTNPEFACEAGIGVIFARLVSIGVHYYWLGKQDIKVEGVDGNGFTAAPSMAIHMMSFKVGFHF